MASFGDLLKGATSGFGALLSNAFPQQAKAQATKNVPVPSGTSGKKPTTSFGQLASGVTSSSPKMASVPAFPAPNVSTITSGSVRPTTGPNRAVAPSPVPSTPTTTLTSSSGGGINIPSFSFDWAAAEREALEKLTPYYEQKLREAEGDVNLAKSRIDEDYARGLRIREEDKLLQDAEDQRSKQEELRNTLTSLNSRGVLSGEIMERGQAKSPYSDYAKSYYLDPLQQRQDARALAIQRAFTRANEISGTDKSRQLEDIGRDFDKYKRNIEEEKKTKAVTQMAPLKYEQELAKYNAALSRSLGVV